MSEAEKLIETYFARMLEIRGGAAVEETSYYGALEALLNAVGDGLKVKVVCNSQIANQGAGHPDFGLYTLYQVRKGEDEKGQMPERGVVEAKGPGEETAITAATVQSNKYLDRYGLLLITNFRDFRLIRRSGGTDIELERYTLAADEAAFWSLAMKPKDAAHHSAHLVEALQRILMTNAPLSKAEDVAWFLASYARDALGELEHKPSAGLDPLRKALEGALGMKFDGKKGEHFFRSTLIQTLFYGVFSAWITHTRKSEADFDWRLAAHGLTVPMVRTLFEEIAKPSRLGALGLAIYLDRASQALNRVERKAFMANLNGDEAIQHFYEPFLAAFDPALRKQLGVWYTPPKIVHYMVERVDRLLRTEFDKPDGLADPSVFVLDPCCGTGAYIVAVLGRIARTLIENGADATAASDLKKAAIERIFGFEIMPAPFVIAHWRIGAFLDNAKHKSTLSAALNERAAIYLTNALTGWEPIEAPKDELPYPEMAEEANAADTIKQARPLLVIIGNPPYNAYSGVSPAEEKGLVQPYKDGLQDRWGVGKWNLDDPYVRFFRIAERRLASRPEGILCYISNASYVDDQSFVVMRERLLTEFDEIWIDNLNGDSRETGKRTPEGKPDPSIFSTPENRAGIRVGTAIGTFCEKNGKPGEAKVSFRGFWGAEKGDELLDSLETEAPAYVAVKPDAYSKLSFKPHKPGANYLSWPSLTDLALTPPSNGLMEKRGGALIDVDIAALRTRMVTYLDGDIDFSDLLKSGHKLAREAARFNPKTARANLLLEGFREDLIVPYLLRPFEYPYAYNTTVRPVWNETRPVLQALRNVPSNRFIVSRPNRVSEPEGVPIMWTANLFDNDAQRGHAYGFPLMALEDHGKLKAKTPVSNISAGAKLWLSSLAPPVADGSLAMWRHVLAIGYSPSYLSENNSGLLKGWPRVPMPASSEKLNASAKIGSVLEVLLDPLSPASGITSGVVRPLHRRVGALSEENYRITAGWGTRATTGQVMPGHGSVTVRPWNDDELQAIAEEASLKGIKSEAMLTLLGDAVDVHLNNDAMWQAVPMKVWDFHIGGYQVLKKWLSYRDHSVMGRNLKPEESKYFRDAARRLTEIVLMGPEFDVNYQLCKADCYPWTFGESHAEAEQAS